MTHIRRDVPRCDPALLRAYEGQAAATVHEAMGRRGALDPAIKPLAADMTVCGRALTVRCHTGDNLMLVKAVSMAGPGDVIVADMGSAVASGPFGEVLAVECMARGAAGLVVSCTVRDSREIIPDGLPRLFRGALRARDRQGDARYDQPPHLHRRRDRPAGRPHRRGCRTASWWSRWRRRRTSCGSPRNGRPRRRPLWTGSARGNRSLTSTGTRGCSTRCTVWKNKGFSAYDLSKMFRSSV